MSDTLTPAEAEATSETTTFRHFDREWTVPSKTRWHHLRQLRADPSNMGIVFAYLDGEQIAAIDELDPTEDEIDAFTDAIMAALGYKNAGNS